MTRRELLAGTPAYAMRQPGPSRGKPNLIFILADDLGCFDLGCYGQAKILTPNIDRLAAEGMRFTHAYAGATVCAPSRCCLLTGLHTGHATVRHNFSLRTTGGRVPLRAEDITLAEVLKGAGYRTGVIGKWGLGEPGTSGVPNRQGFDEWFGYLNQDHAADHYTDHLWRNERKEIIKENRNGARRVYSHDLFTQDAVRFIRTHRREPFFLYLAYTVPHAQYEAPDDEPYSRENWTPRQKNYAAMVTRMDRDIGRIMALLKETGLDANTLVFFSSDNGAGFGEGVPMFKSTGPFRERKRSVYEGGIRVPMIARWPGRIKPHSVSAYPWAFWDILPTAAEAAGAESPPNLDGVSVLPVLLGGEPEKPDRYLYWECHVRPTQQAVRLGDWKAVRHGAKGAIELYDLAADEGENRDAAASRPDIAARIAEILRGARTEAEDYPLREA